MSIKQRVVSFCTCDGCGKKIDRQKRKYQTGRFREGGKASTYVDLCKRCLHEAVRQFLSK